MKNSKQKVTCALAKEIDMVAYLKTAGHQPQKIRNNDFWYFSPLRNEKTPSFKVNKKLNRWYDHGLGKGGNLIDFTLLYHHCTNIEFLQSLESNFSFQQPICFATNSGKEMVDSSIKIINCKKKLKSS